MAFAVIGILIGNNFIVTNEKHQSRVLSKNKTINNILYGSIGGFIGLGWPVMYYMKMKKYFSRKSE